MKDVALDAENEISNSFFRHVVMETADAVVAVTVDQRVVLFNTAAEKLFGYGRKEMLGNSLEILMPRHHRADHAAKVGEFLTSGSQARYMGERKGHLTGLHKDGTELMLGATILTVPTDRGPIMVAMLRDISERITLQRELARLASVDPLTGQLNRRAFLESFEREWWQSCRYKSALSLLLFDLDHFKRINDTYGHDVGDRVICGFSSAARSMLRDTDIFGRWGGEEFIAALPNTEICAARCAAERIRETFSRQLFETEGRSPFCVTVSIGVIDNSDTVVAHQQMIKLADNALYDAKEAGRNQVAIGREAGKLLLC